MTMNITAMPVVSEDRLSEPFALPGGRMLEAKLDVQNTVLASNDASLPADSYRLTVEIKQPGGDFQAVASSRVLVGAGTVTVPVETPAEPLEIGAQPPICRLRLTHHGRRQPLFTLQVLGL